MGNATNDSIVLFKRNQNATSGIPSPTNLEYGEIAINNTKGSEHIFIKNTDDEVVGLGFGDVDALAIKVDNIYNEGENGQVLTKTDNGIEWKNNVNFWKGTLTEYVAIKDKDPDCIYFIVDNNINTGG